MSVNEITLADPTNPGRPAEKVLRLSVVGDLAFVNVSTVDEGNPTTTMTVVAEMVVSRQSLRERNGAAVPGHRPRIPPTVRRARATSEPRGPAFRGDARMTAQHHADPDQASEEAS